MLNVKEAKIIRQYALLSSVGDSAQVMHQSRKISTVLTVYLLIERLWEGFQVKPAPFIPIAPVIARLNLLKIDHWAIYSSSQVSYLVH